jgi:hypothetical protein
MQSRDQLLDSSPQAYLTQQELIMNINDDSIMTLTTMFTNKEVDNGG